MLTGREAHDCPAGTELILQTEPGKTLLGDKAYDSAELRASLKERGTQAITPNKSNRKRKFKFSKKQYRERHRIENAFCRLKDFRRIATRYDKLAVNFAASVYLLAAVVWWTLRVWTLVALHPSWKKPIGRSSKFSLKSALPNLASRRCGAQWPRPPLPRSDDERIPEPKQGRRPHRRLAFGKAGQNPVAPGHPRWPTIAPGEERGTCERVTLAVDAACHASAQTLVT
jgi:transposase